MAEFNPDPGGVPSANMPDQTGASRGSIPNRSWEALFKGLGDIVSTGSQGLDESIQRNIYSETRDVFDTTLQSVVPVGLQNEIRGLEDLQAARADGRLTDVYFYGRLHAGLKSLRAKYPGYEDIVDQSIQQITGERPANKLWESIQEEIDAEGAADAEAANVRLSFENSNQADIAIVAPDYFENPDKYQFNEIRRAVSRLQAERQLLQDEASELEGNQTRATRSGTARLSLEVSARMAGLDNALSFGEGRTFLQTIQDLNSKGATQEELAEVEATVNNYEAQMRVYLNEVMSENLADEGFSSYASILGQEAVNDMIDEALAPFLAMKEAVVNDNLGLAGQIARANTAMMDGRLNELITHPELGQRILTGVALSKLDPTLAAQYLYLSDKNHNLFSDITSHLLAEIVDTPTGEGGVETNDVVTNAVNSTASDEDVAGVINTLVDGSLETVLSSAATPEEKTNAILKLVAIPEQGESVFSILPFNEYLRVYTRVFSPEVTAEVAKLGPNVLNQYYGAALNRFQSIPEFRRAARHLQDNTILYTVELSNNQLVLVPTEVDPSLGIAQETRRVAMDAAQGVIDGVNRGLLLLSPIAEAAGEDPEQTVVSALRSVAFEQDAVRGSTLDNVISRVEQILAPEGEQVVGPSDEVVDTGPIEFDFPDRPPAPDVVEEGSVSTPNSDRAIQEGQTSGDPFQIAQEYLGRDERNTEDARVLSDFFKAAGGQNLDPRVTAWCAAFVNAVLGKAGIQGTGDLAAQSFLEFGTSVDVADAKRGDIIVFERGTEGGGLGHVGFIESIYEDARTGETLVNVLAGNQQTDLSEGESVAVSVRTYDLDRLLGIRRPERVTP